jgi:hypothetical protein
LVVKICVIVVLLRRCSRVCTIEKASKLSEVKHGGIVLDLLNQILSQLIILLISRRTLLLIISFSLTELNLHL